MADQTTEDGAEETGHCGYAGDDGGIERVLVWCAHLREDDKGHGVHYTTADALEGAEYDPWSWLAQWISCLFDIKEIYHNPLGQDVVLQRVQITPDMTEVSPVHYEIDRLTIDSTSSPQHTR